MPAHRHRALTGSAAAAWDFWWVNAKNAKETERGKEKKKRPKRSQAKVSMYFVPWPPWSDKMLKSQRSMRGRDKKGQDRPYAHTHTTHIPHETRNMMRWREKWGQTMIELVTRGLLVSHRCRQRQTLCSSDNARAALSSRMTLRNNKKS